MWGDKFICNILYSFQYATRTTISWKFLTTFKEFNICFLLVKKETRLLKLLSFKISPHSPKIVFRDQKAKVVVATCSGGQSGLLNEIQRAHPEATFYYRVQRLTCAQITKLWLIRRPQTLVGRARHLSLFGWTAGRLCRHKGSSVLTRYCSAEGKSSTRALLSSRAVMKLIKFVSAECRLIKH